VPALHVSSKRSKVRAIGVSTVLIHAFLLGRYFRAARSYRVNRSRDPPANGRPARTACARQCFLGFPRESHPRAPGGTHLRKQTSPRAPKTDPGAGE
jgi:hypothetical protein